MDYYMDAYHSRTPAYDCYRLVNCPLHNGARSTLRHYVLIRCIHPDKLQMGVFCLCYLCIHPARLSASPRRTSLGQAIRDFEMVFPSGSVHPILLVRISIPSSQLGTPLLPFCPVMAFSFLTNLGHSTRFHGVSPREATLSRMTVSASSTVYWTSSRRVCSL